MQRIASQLIKTHGLFESFYIASEQVLKTKLTEWKSELPMVVPHYAVKCNPNKELLKYMISQGVGFDCASRSEIRTVLELGASLDKIIYAHPVKTRVDIDYAKRKGIQYTTFDSLSELEKLSKCAPDMQCLIRLKIDNPSARVQLGIKYGVAEDEYKEMIDYAKAKKLNLVGASFHVGSASKDSSVFDDGIRFCRNVFDYASDKGFSPHIVDVGGGFTKDTFKDCAQVIRSSLVKYDFNTPSTKVIAEPGRYFAEDYMTFFVNVIGQRQRRGKSEYWISDSIYGSFNCVIYDGQTPAFKVLRHPLLSPYNGTDEISASTVFCSTCDSMDQLGDVNLPVLRNGDYLMVENFGAYTLSAACDFNGINMTNPKIFYI